MQSNSVQNSTSSNLPVVKRRQSVYWKVIKSQTLSEQGINVAINKKVRDGQIVKLSVVVRRTTRASRDYRTYYFHTIEEAEGFFDSVLKGEASDPLSPAYIDINSQMGLAREVAVHSRGVNVQPTLELLFAIDRVQSKSANAQYHNTADTCLKILEKRSISSLPDTFAEAAFDAWVSSCIGSLATLKFNAEGVVWRPKS